MINFTGKFPTTRMRRNRKSKWSRKLVQENNLNISDLILPLFVIEKTNITEKIPSMPGIIRYSTDLLIEQVEYAYNLGIPAIILFPNISNILRSKNGKESYNKNNLINKTIRIIKQKVPNIGIICDVALDPYTINGHDGLINNKIILNDESIEILIKQAISHADAGCDIIAPSDMMDGRIGIIRNALDNAGYKNIQIMAYSAKYASAFYGPFRNAIGVNDQLMNNKKTYQMDYSNSSEALIEVSLDIQEGADMIMIKPGMPYLDIIKNIKSEFKIPTFAYQVSGEYSMIMAAVQNGWLDKNKIIIESLMAFKRAGANGICTYFATYIAKLLKNKNILEIYE